MWIWPIYNSVYYWRFKSKLLEYETGLLTFVFSVWTYNSAIKKKYKVKNKLILSVTWMTRHRWQSEASSRPCFSAQESTRPSLFINFRPHSLVHRPSCGSSTSLLKSHMLIKWNNWENTWMVSAALTLHLRSRDMADDRVYSTSDMLGRLPLRRLVPEMENTGCS